ncbi:hypothetical protein BT63DRAFT_263243 [Microthyrium microscopicum]|uniref:CUE domain-containing protein n=1 Tax=Microthyrium microscopicum TaxID=703497 RepID=A0A6A6UD04_9PEZI|nr:hypothetical protein BT63DRAFT_263243 [Microthyrium microscopicum]
MADPTEATLNIPQIAVLLVISFLAIRWVLAPRAEPAPGSSARSATDGPRANPQHVETISQMFPQADQRAIMWDLMRNNNNPAITTERLITGRGLATPPQSFQPVLLTGSTPTPSASRVLDKSGPDLIQRYNLSAKLAEQAEQEEADKTKPKWSTNKTERQTLLQKRREEMILAARRKMLEKEKASS